MAISKIRIRKDDIVQIVSGKEKGKKGKALHIFPDSDRIVVEKLNMVKRHTKPNQQMRQGGIIEKEGKIHISNVMLVCNRCDKKIRVGRKILENGKKVRVCKKCEEVIDQ